jgi:hypothetical protein
LGLALQQSKIRTPLPDPDTKPLHGLHEIRRQPWEDYCLRLKRLRKGRGCCDPMVSFVDRSVLGSFDTTYLPRDSFEFLKLAAANSFSNFGAMCTYE